MSVTRTRNAPYYNTLSVLADYEVHHSPASPPRTEDLEEHPAGQAAENPPAWDDTHRRVPTYRPTNLNLDLSTRDVYQNGAERFFVNTMFVGVFTVHVSSKSASCFDRGLGIGELILFRL